MQSHFLAYEMSVSQHWANPFALPILAKPRQFRFKLPILQKRPDPSKAMFPRSAIVVLLFWKRPPAILWRIWAIVVDAVYPVVRRWFSPHVGKEVLEGIPSTTDGDSSSPIVSKLLMPCIIAALFQRFPCAIFRCLVAPELVAVNHYAHAYLIAGVAN